MQVAQCGGSFVPRSPSSCYFPWYLPLLASLNCGLTVGHTVVSRKRAHGCCTLLWAKTRGWADICDIATLTSKSTHLHVCLHYLDLQRVLHFKLQGVVTYALPVEAFATGINNLDWWKSFRGSWSLDFTGVQRTKRSHASLVSKKVRWSVDNSRSEFVALDFSKILQWKSSPRKVNKVGAF